MAIALPKDKRFLIGFRFPELIPFEINDISLIAILAPIFRFAILEGRDSSKGKVEEIGDVSKSITALVCHPRMQGFESPVGRRMAERTALASLVRTTRNLKSKQLQIDGLIPYTIATFKVGFPSTLGGFRQVDRFVYDLLVDEWRGNKQEVAQFIIEIFGEGIEVRGGAEPQARRRSGDLIQLDVLSELSLAYVDGFGSIVPKATAAARQIPRPLPHYQERFGSDLYRFLWSYSKRVPRALLVEQVVGLIGFELSILTAKMIRAVPELASKPEQLPIAMAMEDVSSPPEIYVDLITDPRHRSRAMAVGCIRRDTGRIDSFTQAVLNLRYLYAIAVGLKSDPEFRPIVNKYLADSAKLSTPQFVQQLISLAYDSELRPEFRREARAHLKSIIEANMIEPRDEDESDSFRSESEADQLVKRLESLGKDQLQQVQEFLFAVQGSQTQIKVIKWIRDVGGIGMPVGLISGGTNRRTWAYAPTNDLLTVLVQLCAIDYEGWSPAKGAQPEVFGLADFLEWLERRFGIIVDRPPADLGFDGPEHAAAARENLQALLRRLRQMGMFEDQSDDFSVQTITPPFMDVASRDARDAARLAG